MRNGFRPRRVQTAEGELERWNAPGSRPCQRRPGRGKKKSRRPESNRGPLYYKLLICRAFAVDTGS
jgi:hypothetical protein